MEFLPLLMFAGLSLFVVATESNENRTKSDSIGHLERFATQETHRKGRQFLLPGRINIPITGTRTRRIIKIPSNVSKVRFIETVPVEGSRGTKRFPFPHRKPNDVRWQQQEEKEEGEDYPMEESKTNDFQRNWIGQYDEDLQGMNGRNGKKPLKTKKFSNHEGEFQNDDGHEIFMVNGNAIMKNRRRKGDDCSEPFKPCPKPLRPTMQSRVSSMTTIPLNFVEKPVFRKYYYDPNHGVTAWSFNGRRQRGKGRKSLLNPQYTTHNPHVATNFGLPNHYASSNQFYQFLPGGQLQESIKNPAFGKMKNYEDSIAVATDQIVNKIPQKFGEPFGYSMNPPVLTNHPYQYSPQGRNLSQRATLKDILDQDCPGHEVIGFCESPPRYPMHQIDAILKKCWRYMEVMGTQNLMENRDFSRRSDSVADLNNTIPMEFDFDRVTAPKRASVDGVQACQSQFTLVEPGYAREVTSGKWYVVVQNAETAQQRITTDTCSNMGKPCDGLTQMQCDNRNNHANRSTRCVQRFAYHRLISWDPDVPSSCPRMRIFKFPSACVCHVDTMPFP